jgi:hypothetical protein
MEKILKIKWVTFILIFVLVSAIFVFAGDVTVQDGDLDVDGELNVGGDLKVDGVITGPSAEDYPNAYVNYLYVDYYLYVNYTASVYSTFQASYIYSGTINCYKLNADVVDPAGVLYDIQTRQQIIDTIKLTIPPEKQGGALVFFNKDTKRLETYVPNEGKFYDLQGNLTFTMPSVDVAKDYKTVYYLDIMTGEVKARQEVVVDRYIVKQGYILDEETGHFIHMPTGEVVPIETAVELVEAP